jgi:hypothetical protein
VTSPLLLLVAILVLICPFLFFLPLFTASIFPSRTVSSFPAPSIVHIASSPSAAISHLNWTDRTTISSQLLRPEEHCQFRFLAHAEGLGASGRLKYLTQCRSVIVTHKWEFIQVCSRLLPYSSAMKLTFST